MRTGPPAAPIPKRLRSTAAAGLVVLATASPSAARAVDCPFDTYPRPGETLQGTRIYATLSQVHPTSGPCSARIDELRDGITTIGSDRRRSTVDTFASSTFSELELGRTYEAVVVTTAWEPDRTIREQVEHLVPFTVEPLGETFDVRSVVVDRAEAVVSDDLSRITTTVEGRWPGPVDHHFLMFSTLDHTALMAWPDPDDGGAFTFVYEQEVRDEDRRRRFDVIGDLRAVSPDGPSGGEWIPLVLLEDVDLRTEACGCATAQPAAGWPAAGLATLLLLRRRRDRRDRDARVEEAAHRPSRRARNDQDVHQARMQQQRAPQRRR